MPYYVGDVPAQYVVIDPPETVDLTLFDAASALLTPPTGSATALPAAIVDDQVHVAFPLGASVFNMPGPHTLSVVLTDTSGLVQALPVITLIVQDPDHPDGWHTVDSIRDEWPDAQHIDDAVLWRLLEQAKLEVSRFAPDLGDTDPVPSNYRDGQGMQARNRWNARRVAPDGTMGQDDFVIRPFPLDWQIQQTLRPRGPVRGGGIA